MTIMTGKEFCLNGTDLSSEEVNYNRINGGLFLVHFTQLSFCFTSPKIRPADWSYMQSEWCTIASANWDISPSTVLPLHWWIDISVKSTPHSKEGAPVLLGERPFKDHQATGTSDGSPSSSRLKSVQMMKHLEVTRLFKEQNINEVDRN